MSNHIKQFWQLHHLRLLVVGLLVLAVAASILVLKNITIDQMVVAATNQVGEIKQKNLLLAVADFKSLKTKTAAIKAGGVDVSTVESQLPGIKQKLFSDLNPSAAVILIKTASATLDDLNNQKLAADQLAATLGTLTGKVSDSGTGLGGAVVSLLIGSTVSGKATTDQNGQYSVTVPAGSYTLSASKSGYATFRKYNTIVTAKTSTSLDVALTKAVSVPVTSGSDSTANSSYERKTISTNRGDFLVDLMTFNLGAIKVVTDTANDSDCTNNCPTKSLASYVGDDGALAGINGTYFCPPDYASCAGQTGSFFWKVRNTRLGKTINQSNGLGENEAYLTFNSSAVPTYYYAWTGAPVDVYAGVNSGPRLVENGANVLTDSSMDDKQRTVKSNRGAIGYKGQTMYALVAKSATIPDMAAILTSLGVTNAMNLDGGGSSAIYYKGSYKVGPGRSLPNAVLFVGN